GAGSIRGLPEGRQRLFACRRKRDALSVRGPCRIKIVTRSKREPRERLSSEVPDPDVVVLIPDVDSGTSSIGRHARRVIRSWWRLHELFASAAINPREV